MSKILTYFLGALAVIMGVVLIFILNIFLIPVLGYWTILVDFIYIFAGLALISYVGDLSIPVIKTLLKREYYRVKFKIDKKGEKASPGFYLKFLASLIVLFKSAEGGYEVIKEESHILHSKALLFVEKENGDSGTKASHKQLFNVHKTKQRRAATISAGTLILLVIGSVIVGLLSSLIFPAIYQSQAATYTWIQNDWSGGASTTVAVHPGDASGWTNYFSKDDNIVIDGSGNITMSSGSQDMEDDLDADFNQGNYVKCLKVTGDTLTMDPDIDYEHNGYCMFSQVTLVYDPDIFPSCNNTNCKNLDNTACRNQCITIGYQWGEFVSGASSCKVSGWSTCCCPCDCGSLFDT